MNPKPAILPPEEELRDLGFGAVVARESRERLLNRDGSFNFFGIVSAGYLATNALFTVAYFFSVQTLATIGHGRVAPFTLPEGSRS